MSPDGQQKQFLRLRVHTRPFTTNLETSFNLLRLIAKAQMMQEVACSETEAVCEEICKMRPRDIVQNTGIKQNWFLAHKTHLLAPPPCILGRWDTEDVDGLDFHWKRCNIVKHRTVFRHLHKNIRYARDDLKRTNTHTHNDTISFPSCA